MCTLLYILFPFLLIFFVYKYYIGTRKWYSKGSDKGYQEGVYEAVMLIKKQAAKKNIELNMDIYFEHTGETWKL